MSKGQGGTKRNRNDDDDIVSAIEGIEIPDPSDAIERALGQIPDYSEQLEGIQSTIRQGFADLVEALTQKPKPRLNLIEFGNALCEYVDMHHGTIGGMTISFAIVPDPVKDATVLFEQCASIPLLMGMRIKQWDLLADVDDDILREHVMRTNFSAYDSTRMSIESITKKRSACGKRLEVSARVKWWPHEKYLAAEPEFCRSLRCQRAAVAFMGMCKFDRVATPMSGVPRDVIRLIGKYIMDTKGKNNWKSFYRWF